MRPFGSDDAGSGSGSAYVYRYDGSTWVQEAKLTGSDTAPNDSFGISVSVSGDVAVFGARFDDDRGNDSGSAYIFSVFTDCNNNGILDSCDIASGTSQDCNGDGIPDECEFGQPLAFVDADAAGLNDGTSWTDAFNDLQDALCLAGAPSSPVTEVWVAEGTYMPDGGFKPDGGSHAPGSGDRAATFQLITGVGLYGGFAGSETQRDPATNVTVLSGDLLSNDLPEFTNNADNAYHVVMGSGTEPSAVLDGFRVTAGNANGGVTADQVGAGLKNSSG